MIKCIAVDDEPLALNIIKIFCDKIDDLELCASFTNGLEALKYTTENEIDVAFLDINMLHISGVELAKQLSDDIAIIFTTAYQSYALEGFELNALDYLLKPFSFDRFSIAVDRAVKYKELIDNSNNEDDGETPFMMIRSDYSTVRVEIASIICVEGLKDYVKIYTDHKNYVTKITMKNIEKYLSVYDFMRVHKSYIINLSKIISVDSNQVIMTKDIQVALGNSYKVPFLEYLQKNKL